MMAITGVNHVCFLLLILISISTISRSEDSDADCVYTIYVKTGFRLFAGTDSIISLTVNDTASHGFRINNLVAWGGVLGHNYFEPGNVDIFNGTGPCLTGPACYMNLTSDGSGDFSGWYCDYVNVITSWPGHYITLQHFEVRQWLATDLPPFKLTAIRNICPKLGRIGDYSQSSPLAMEM